MFRATSRAANASFKRFYASASHEAPASTQTEIDVTKVFGIAVLGGVSLYFYRSASPEPVVETAYYKQLEDRDSLRSEGYTKRYKTSFIKTFIRDKGGVGMKHLRGPAQAPIPQTYIRLHSPYGEQFGAGIKTDKLGPRKERIRYFAPMEN